MSSNLPPPAPYPPDLAHEIAVSIPHGQQDAPLPNSIESSVYPVAIPVQPANPLPEPPLPGVVVDGGLVDASGVYAPYGQPLVMLVSSNSDRNAALYGAHAPPEPGTYGAIRFVERRYVESETRWEKMKS